MTFNWLWSLSHAALNVTFGIQLASRIKKNLTGSEKKIKLKKVGMIKHLDLQLWTELNMYVCSFLFIFTSFSLTLFLWLIFLKKRSWKRRKEINWQTVNVKRRETATQALPWFSAAAPIGAVEAAHLLLPLNVTASPRSVGITRHADLRCVSWGTWLYWIIQCVALPTAEVRNTAGAVASLRGWMVAAESNPSSPAQVPGEHFWPANFV